MNIFKNIILGIDNFFLYFMIIWGIILLIITIISLVLNWKNDRKKKYKNEIKKDFDMPVSIILPVYNEEKNMIEILDSLLHLDYKLYEIIIIDDGSKDKTVEKIVKHYGLKRIEKVVRKKIETEPVNSYYEKNGDIKMIVVKKEHGGVADALNVGVNIARYPYLLTVSSKVKVKPDILTELMKPIIEKKNISAVFGNIKRIGKNKTYFNMVEDIKHNRVIRGRSTFDLYNGNIVSEEGILLLKKEYVFEVGGYQKNTICEDIELLLSIHQYALANKKEYEIEFVPRTVGYLEYADTRKELRKREQRETAGIIQSMMKHKNMFLKPKYKFVGTVSFLYYFIMTYFMPFLESLAILSMIVSCTLNYISLDTFFMYLLIYILIGTILNIMTMLSETDIKKMNSKDYLSMLCYCFLWNIGFRQISNVNDITSFLVIKNNEQ